MMRCFSNSSRRCDPYRGRWDMAISHRWCRCAQPPANRCNASGVKEARPKTASLPALTSATSKLALPANNRYLNPTPKENAMKYMLLVYGTEGNWTEAERAQCMSESTKICHELAAQGK